MIKIVKWEEKNEREIKKQIAKLEYKKKIKEIELEQTQKNQKKENPIWFRAIDEE